MAVNFKQFPNLRSRTFLSAPFNGLLRSGTPSLDASLLSTNRFLPEDGLGFDGHALIVHQHQLRRGNVICGRCVEQRKICVQPGIGKVFEILRPKRKARTMSVYFYLELSYHLSSSCEQENTLLRIIGVKLWAPIKNAWFNFKLHLTLEPILWDQGDNKITSIYSH